MRHLNIPSISLCIYRRGKRMLSVSYGYSDLRAETRVKLTYHRIHESDFPVFKDLQKQASPLNSYRIASISKTMTAMGIAELINRRLLNLESRVFGLKGRWAFTFNLVSHLLPLLFRLSHCFPLSPSAVLVAVIVEALIEAFHPRRIPKITLIVEIILLPRILLTLVFLLVSPNFWYLCHLCGCCEILTMLFMLAALLLFLILVF